MTRPFRFAVQTLRLRERDSAIDEARAAERLGYAEIYSSDHLGAVDRFAPLVLAAAVTDRLGVGPLVLNNEFHHPVLLARTAATVDRLSGGRLLLGMGTGYMQSEHDAMDVPLRAPGPRVDRFEESLVVLRELLDTGRCHFEGAHHRVHVDDLGIRPAQDRVPFLIGGHGRRVVGVAARHADIYQFTGLTHGEGGAPAPGGFARSAVAKRARWLDESERSPAIERSVLVQATQVGGDTARVAEQLAARFGLDAAVLAECPFVLVGSAEQLVDKLERQRAALGISHVVARDVEGFAPVVAALAGR